jgi:DNA-binding NarL/FixJ family response regulator
LAGARQMAKTILIADDSAQVRGYVAKLLRANQAFELCEEAVDGLDAIAKAKKCNPDLAILDLGMPVMNGLETAKELKRIMPTLPIILFTLHGHVISDDHARLYGIDLVVAKSDITRLSDHVRSLLEPV